MTMSSWRVPSMTSYGVSCNEFGSMFVTFGTTTARSVSRTRQVSVRPNASPTRTPFLSAFHQQLIGLGPVSSAAVPVAGDWAAACPDTQVPQVKRMIAVRMDHDFLYMNLDPLVLTLELAQPPLGHEVDEGSLHFPPVKPHPHDVEISVARQALNRLLPLVNPRNEPAQLASGEHSRPIGLHIKDFNPARRHIRQLECEPCVGHDQEDVMDVVQKRQLGDDPRCVRVQEI